MICFQGQCLLNVSGDAASVYYDAESGLSDSFGRAVSPRKHRATSLAAEYIPHSPIKSYRRRSATEGYTGGTMSYVNDPCYGTEI